jgi:predicted DNA-binding transcriptional regulator YafY
MTRRKQVDTLIGIIQAFFEDSTWKQAELARRVGVTVETLRTTLESLTENGWPLEREDDHPHVYWSVPKGWFAGGVLLTREDATEALRLLARLPESETRDRLIKLLVRSAPPSSQSLPASSWHPSGLDAEQEATLRRIEDAIARREAVEIRYYSSSRGLFEWRAVSFLQVVPGVTIRTCAVCHRTDSIRWFRLDGITGIRAADSEYRGRSSEEVTSFLVTSVDGFHDGRDPEEVRFVVRDPEARWVEKNLLAPMEAVRIEDGIEVRVRSAGLTRVARYVVSLGPAARATSSELAAMVLELAKGAIERYEPST